MVDQTLPEINAVHEKNKARRYYYRLEKDFEKTLTEPISEQPKPKLVQASSFIRDAAAKKI